MYKILKNIIEMDDYSVQKLSKSQSEPFQWNTVEGTEINVDDCIGGKGKIEVKENTYQKQLSGKNKFGVSERSEVVADVDCVFKDSEILINGAQTTGRSSSKLTFKDILPAGTYHIKPKVISGTCVNGSGDHALSIVITDTNNTKLVDKWLDALDMDFTLSEETQLNFSIWIPAGAQFNNYKVGIQIEEGSTATDYEPYCGGQPSPNPDYPQEIKVVTGNNLIKHVGKNLLNIADGTYANNGVTAVVENGKITLNGTPINGTSFIKIPFHYEYNGLTYSLSANNNEVLGGKTGSENCATLRIAGQATTQAVLGNKNAIVTFVLDNTYNDITIRTGHGLTYNNFVIYSQLEIGQPTSKLRKYGTMQNRRL